MLGKFDPMQDSTVMTHLTPRVQMYFLIYFLLKMYNENNVNKTFDEKKKLVAQEWLEKRSRTTEAPKSVL